MLSAPELCTSCHESVQAAVEKTKDWPGTYVNISHHESSTALLTAAALGCPICTWLTNQPLTADTSKTLNDISPIRLTSSLQTLHKWEDDLAAIELSFVVRSSERKSIASAAIFATPTTDDVPVALPPQPVTIQAVKWINTCTATHTACPTDPTSKNGTPSWKPSRLLHIRALSDGTFSMQLIEPSSESYNLCKTYTALSHRWSEHEVMLTSKTSTNFRISIPIHLLKQSIHDAAKLSLELGIHYIWIDTLCIIQDSDSDKDNEISCMELVYGSCYCNIAVSGELKTNEDRCEMRQNISLHTYNVRMELGRDLLGGPKVWQLRLKWNDKELKQSILSSRAWVYQERYLSPRILSICNDQAYWECAELVASQTYSEARPKQDAVWTAFTFGMTDASEVRKPEDVFNDWYSVVWDYTRGNLTFQSDRLRALTGVSNLYRKKYHMEYLFGIWKESMPHSLLWEVLIMSRPARPFEDIAPSWSWASVSGRIGITWIMRGPSRAATSVVTCFPSTSSLFLGPSNLDTAWLLPFQGKLWRATVTDEYDHSLNGRDNSHCLQPEEIAEWNELWEQERPILSATLDCEEVLPLSVVCLPLMTRSEAYFPDGLILIAVAEQETPARYKRVGIYQGRPITNDFLSGLPQQDILIV